jgi:short-subunit dehydrogenase
MQIGVTFRTSDTPVALVTGGSMGIGLACVRAFLNKGWRVSACALPSSELDQLAGPKTVTIGGDLALAKTRQAAVERTVGHYGRIDALVNCAGVGLYAPAAATPPALLSRLLKVNAVAPLALAQLVIPRMMNQGSGVIVNLSSVSASVALPWAAGYCASKAALDSLHESLRRELAGSCIHLVKVCAGVVDTGFRDHVLAGKAPEQVLRIRWVVSAETVAARIVRAVERRHRTVYVPRIARLFTLGEVLAPGLMDHYLRRFGGLAAADDGDSRRDQKMSTAGELCDAIDRELT